MKKFLRRMSSALLAACTLWVVIATAESRSLSAAVAAMQESFQLPQVLLRLELSDLPKSGAASLSTLLCLGQSPLLWAAYGTLPEETPPEPQPQPEPEPQPDPLPASSLDLSDGLTFADNGAPSQTVIPTSSASYAVAGSVFIKNGSGKTVDTALLDGSFPAELGDSAQPQVLILHTHGSEAYTMPTGEEYSPSGSYRTADTEKNMIRVGDEMASVLSQYGISVLHDRRIHDSDYNSAYGEARAAAVDYLQQYPSLSFILDIHRDAISDADGQQYKLVTREDPRAAQLSIVLGNDHDAWMDNLRLASAVQAHLLAEHPTLMRPIILRPYIYNQNLCSGSLLVEIGAAGNSLDEAIYSARLFAAGFAETIGGQKQ